MMSRETVVSVKHEETNRLGGSVKGGRKVDGNKTASDHLMVIAKFAVNHYDQSILSPVFRPSCHLPATRPQVSIQHGTGALQLQLMSCKSTELFTILPIAEKAGRS